MKQGAGISFFSQSQAKSCPAIEPLRYTQDELRRAIREEYEHLESLEDVTAQDLIDKAFDNLAKKPCITTQTTKPVLY